MAETDLILKFEIAPERAPEADAVAAALVAWVDVLRTAAAVVEPGATLSVELVGVEAGSQVFKLALRKMEGAAERVITGSKEFPLVSKAAMSLGALIGGTMVVVTITNQMTPDPRIPDDQMAVFQEMNRNLAESVELQRQTARFWGVVQDEPAFDRVDVLRGFDRKPVYQVPRSEFAERSGIWSGDDEQQVTSATETRRVVWDVILVKPVLVPEERRWTFAKDGLEFSALMTDKAILQAIHDKTLPIQIAEGIPMKLDIRYRERFDGKVWLPISGSHRVKRVISPQPPMTSGLFAAPSGP